MLVRPITSLTKTYLTGSSRKCATNPASVVKIFLVIGKHTSRTDELTNGIYRTTNSGLDTPAGKLTTKEYKTFSMLTSEFGIAVLANVGTE